MKSSQLFPLCFGTALAGDLISSQFLDLCLSPFKSLPFLSNPVCSGDGPNARHQEVVKHSNATTGVWTHASPCFRNGTAEYCIYSSATFAENRGISLLTTPKRAAQISQSLAFTSPEVHQGVNQDIVQTRRHRYKSIPIPGKDLGLVATEPLKVGDHIISNTVSLMIDYAAFENIPQSEMLKMQGRGVDYLPEHHRSRFLQLSTHSGAEDYLQKVEKILQTNAFDVEVEAEAETEINFYVVFNEMSRMNHDCRPNADYYWDPETLTQHVHVIRPIAAGEEITLSYIDPYQSRAKRVKLLSSSWGFQCGCSSCTQNAHQVAASDERVEQIMSLRRELRDLSAKSRANPQMAELLVSLHEQERLLSGIYEAYALAALEHNGVGDPWTATKYARLAVEYGLAAAGPSNADVLEMESLAEDPWGHWSWMFRNSSRGGWKKTWREKPKEDQSD